MSIKKFKVTELIKKLEKENEIKIKKKKGK